MGPYRHLLLAVDFSEEEDHVGEHAVELARLFGARLSLLHVVERRDEDAGPEVMPPIPSAPGDEAIAAAQNIPDPAPAIAGTDQPLLDKARRFLGALANRLGIPGSEKIVVGSSSVHSAISDTARRIGADLVVVGLADRHWFSLLRGSTTERVLRDSPCNVLAVRSRPSSVEH